MAGFAFVGLAAGIFFIARGADGRPMLVVCGLVTLVGVAVIGFGVARVEVQQRDMTKEERDAAYAGRLEEAQQ
jgi:Tfp pilus assembly protein PilX